MNSGFVAGTLVHTDKGLVPIQNLNVGDLVLSMPKNSVPNEDGSCNTAYKPITKIYKSETKQPIVSPFAVSYGLVAPNQLFWTKEFKWVRADELDRTMQTFTLNQNYHGNHFMANDFSFGSDRSDEKIYLIETPFPNIVVGFKVNERLRDSWWASEPYVIDFNKKVDEFNYLLVYPHPSDQKIWLGMGDWKDGLSDEDKKIYLQAIEFVYHDDSLNPFCDYVYNIEVADYHTYFVEELGFWIGDSTIQGNDE